jgi:histidyl-tRNA synthetase
LTLIIKYLLDTLNASLGSLAAGGRYDNLISMLDPKFQVKCVGLSIGVERLYTILEEKYLNSTKGKLKCSNTQVYIATPQKGFLDERLSLCEELWQNEIRVSIKVIFCFCSIYIFSYFKTEFSYKSNGRLLDQLTYCEENQIPICIIIGNEEIKNNSVKIRNVITRIEVSLIL